MKLKMVKYVATGFLKRGEFGFWANLRLKNIITWRKIDITYIWRSCHPVFISYRQIEKTKINKAASKRHLNPNFPFLRQPGVSECSASSDMLWGGHTKFVILIIK